MAVALTISNRVDFKMDVAHAVGALRLQEFECCSMFLEKARVLPWYKSLFLPAGTC